MHPLLSFRFAATPLCALAVFVASAQTNATAAGQLTPADKVWIATCIADRAHSGRSKAQLRKYCTCMQEVVDDNRPFESITALERTYPPAHRVCRGGQPE